MKKESLIAIFLGVIFGLITASLIVDNLLKNNLEKVKSLPQKKEKNVITPVKTFNLKLLSIEKPKNNLIVYEDKITIEGSADKDSLIVIQSPVEDEIFQNKKERFKIDFPLALGENVIKIVVYSRNPNLKNQEKTLYIYYLPKKEL